MPRYSAKLLFQWDPDPIKGKKSRLRICEERIVTFKARSSLYALQKAKKIGYNSECTLKLSTVDARFQFVGIRQMMELTSTCAENEVWYEISKKILPLERRKKLLPPEDKLFIFADGGIKKRMTKAKKLE